MKKLLQLLNGLESEGLYDRWALSGATALAYYIGPVNTEDFDVVVSLSQDRFLVTLTPLYAALAMRGYTEVVGEHVHIEGTPVQFLMASPGIAEEALSKAKKVSLFGTRIRIFPLEHLMAIMLQLSRQKDKERLVTVISEHRSTVPWQKFRALLKRHGLTDKFAVFRKLRGV